MDIKREGAGKKRLIRRIVLGVAGLLVIGGALF